MNFLSKFRSQSEIRSAPSTVAAADMPLQDIIIPPRPNLEARAAPASYLPASFGINLRAFSDSGVQITENNVLICSAAWGCISLISQTVSTLPIHVVSKDEGTKQYDHPLYKVLTESPNPYMSPVIFREVLLNQALIYGGSYAAIERDGVGNVIGLYPLRSPDVKPKRQNGMLVFECRVGSNTFTLTTDRMVYLPGWTLDGISPMSPVRAASQALGLSVAMERFAAKTFGNGGNHGGVLSTGAMSDDAMKTFLDSWRLNYTGLDNAFKIAILPDPIRFTPTTLDPEKTQLTDTRKAQVLEVCRYWKVPPSMLGIMEGVNYGSLEQLNEFFYQYTVLPWLVKLEQEIGLKCLLEAEKSKLEVKFTADGLLRASTQERMDAYNTAITSGVMTRAEARAKEGLPFIPGSDTLLMPLNMTPVGPDGKPVAPPPHAAEDDEGDDDTSRALIEDAARRVLMKEVKAVTRAAKKYAGKSEEFRAWAQDWYATHETRVAGVFVAPIKAAGGKLTAANYAKRHCDFSLRSLTNAITAGTVDDLTDDFETIRPGDIVGEILE